MDVSGITQAGNTLSIDIKYAPFEETVANVQSDKYFCGALHTEFKINSFSFTGKSNALTGKSNNGYCVSLSVKFRKLLTGDDSTYICKFSSSNNCRLLVNELRVYDDQWYQIFYSTECKCYNTVSIRLFFNITINCEIIETQCIFASLYDDTQSADFKLCSEDSSVTIHKTILAAYSPVFKTMLEGEWKESMEGRVELQGVSLETLQHLKDYMYLNKLPETGLQELCALASCYMIPKLVVQCCAKILNKLTTDNAMEVAEFALKNKLMPFYATILRKITIDKFEACSSWPWSMEIGKSNNLEK